MERAPLGYRLLLRAYPRAFRDLYARELEQAFVDLRRRARADGVAATATLWCRTGWDLLRTGLAERLSRRGYRFGRSRLRLPRRGPLTWAADVAHDTGVALRGLSRARGYAAAVIGTLALGIGANTALFSVAHGVLLRPLPFGSGERLVYLSQEDRGTEGTGSRGLGYSVKDLEDFAAASVTLEEVAEYHRMSFTLVDARGPHRVRAGVVSSNYSDFLGLRPLHGRLFDPAEDRLGAEPVLVLAHGYWMERFGGDPAVVGRRVRMNGSDHEIVGVLPPTPQFPHENDLYLPISICPTRSHPLFIGDRSARMMYAYGRLRPGVSLADARMDLERVAARLRAEHGEVYDLGGRYSVDAVPLRDQIVGRARPVVTALLAVSGLLLLIACANAGNLALARARRRARELDLRSALGAGGGRLVGTLLLEGVLLALAGGMLGLLVAFGGHDVLVRFAARFTTRAGEIELDRTVLLFTFAASVTAGLVFGSVPGWLVGRSRGRLEGGGAGARRRDRRLQRALVTGQVAFAFGVVATAGFALRTAWHVSRAEVGFETESVLTFHVMLDDPRYASDDAFAAFWGDAMSGIRALPRVAAAGRANEVPFGSADDDPRHAFFLRGPSDETGTAAAAVWRVVDPEVFDVLGLRVELGSGFGEAPSDVPRAAVVNRTFWDQYVAGRLDLGATLRRCDENGHCDPPMRVVGVVSDGRYDLPEREPVPEVYQRADPSTWRGNDLLVRVAGGDPLSVAADIRALVAELDPQVALADVMTLEELKRERSAPQRLFALLLLAFAAVGAGLALAGVFGVASLAAASRLRELGIRRALGATAGSLGGLVVLEGLAVTLPGLAMGLGLALAGGALLARSLPGAAPVDPLSLALTGALFLFAALVAIWLPARRAARADAAEILHAP